MGSAVQSSNVEEGELVGSLKSEASGYGLVLGVVEGQREGEDRGADVSASHIDDDVILEEVHEGENAGGVAANGEVGLPSAVEAGAHVVVLREISYSVQAEVAGGFNGAPSCRVVSYVACASRICGHAGVRGVAVFVSFEDAGVAETVKVSSSDHDGGGGGGDARRR